MTKGIATFTEQCSLALENERRSGGIAATFTEQEAKSATNVTPVPRVPPALVPPLSRDRIADSADPDVAVERLKKKKEKNM